MRGSFLAYGHEATLIVLGIEITATIYFAADEHFPVNVLGRVGWLDRFELIDLGDHRPELFEQPFIGRAEDFSQCFFDGVHGVCFKTSRLVT